MDAPNFDALTRWVTARAPRRTLLGVVVTSLLSMMPDDHHLMRSQGLMGSLLGGSLLFPALPVAAQGET